MATKLWLYIRNADAKNPKLISFTKQIKPKSILIKESVSPDVLEKLNKLWNSYIREIAQQKLNKESLVTLIMRCELIGANVEVVSCTNRTVVGLSGIVLGDTETMMSIQTSKGLVKHIKKGTCSLLFRCEGSNSIIYIEGQALERSIERRAFAKILVDRKVMA